MRRRSDRLAPPRSAQSAAPPPLQATQPKRNSLCGLPAELKARIVQLCAEQDEWFRQWLKDREDDKVELAQSGSWNGRSVSAVFLVSKEFSSLAAGELFKVLRASKVNSRFMDIVVHRCLPLFLELRLDSAYGPIAAELLPLLPRLRSVRRLVVQKEGLGTFWLASPTAFQLQPPEAARVQQVATGFERLPALVDIQLHVVAAHQPVAQSLITFVRNKDALRCLSLTFGDGEFSRGASYLVELVQAASSLRNLTLDFRRGSLTKSLPFDLNAVRRDLSTVPPLTRLAFSSHDLHPAFFSFATAFSATLKELRLAAKLSQDFPTVAPEPPLFREEHFPFVVRLSILGDTRLVSPTLASIRPSHFPSLASLEISLNKSTNWTGGAAPLDAFGAFPGLVSLDVADGSKCSTSTLDAICNFCWDKGTLDYVQWELLAAKATGDFARIERLAAGLRPFEAERRAKEKKQQAVDAWNRA
ncbi:hypothetical protein JCM8097_000795 [Rhodosporidiobolus ruineniae]